MVTAHRQLWMPVLLWQCSCKFGVNFAFVSTPKIAVNSSRQTRRSIFSAITKSLGGTEGSACLSILSRPVYLFKIKRVFWNTLWGLGQSWWLIGLSWLYRIRARAVLWWYDGGMARDETSRHSSPLLLTLLLSPSSSKTLHPPFFSNPPPLPPLPLTPPLLSPKFLLN